MVGISFLKYGGEDVQILFNSPDGHIPSGAVALNCSHRLAESAASLSQQIHYRWRPARILAQRLISQGWCCETQCGKGFREPVSRRRF